jgi:hypothetical protein
MTSDIKEKVALMATSAYDVLAKLWTICDSYSSCTQCELLSPPSYWCRTFKFMNWMYKLLCLRPYKEVFDE